MNAVPQRFSTAELRPHEREQVCEACGTPDSQATRRWVRCPMLGDAAICYGCCLDLQGLARTLDFATDPYRDLFDGIAEKTGRPVTELRRTCLEHQQELIGVQLNASRTAEERDALIVLAGRVSAAAIQTADS